MTNPDRPDLSKWIDDAGRIRQYPRRPGDRSALLAAIAGQVLFTDEVLAEHELNQRLRRFTDDIAALRRYLVVAGHVNRTSDGSEYRSANLS